MCAEVDAALEDLQRLVARYQEVQQDSAATQSRIAAIRRQQQLAGDRRAAPGAGPARTARCARRHALGTPRRRRAGVAVRADRAARRQRRRLPRHRKRHGRGGARAASDRSRRQALPFALNNVASRLRKNDRTLRRRRSATPIRTRSTWSTSTPTTWDGSRTAAASAYFADRYTIGYWFWELSAFREEWVPFFGYVDEVWAASEFMRASFAAWSPVPVVRMPLPVVLPPIPPLGRSHFGLRDGRHRVPLHLRRVEPDGAEEPVRGDRAFRQAGFTADEAVLVLKFTNAEYDRAAVARLHEEAAGLAGRRSSTATWTGPRSSRSWPPATATCRRTGPKASA